MKKIKSVFVTIHMFHFLKPIIVIKLNTMCMYLFFFSYDYPLLIPSSFALSDEKRLNYADKYKYFYFVLKSVLFSNNLTIFFQDIKCQLEKSLLFASGTVYFAK